MSTALGVVRGLRGRVSTTLGVVRGLRGRLSTALGLVRGRGGLTAYRSFVRGLRGGLTAYRSFHRSFPLGWAALVACLAIAFLVSSGLWFVALGLLLAPPALVLIHRYPLAAVAIWFVVAPLVAVTDSGGVRQVFWLVHRALPPGTLVLIALAWVTGVSDRRLARLGWAEAMMAGYAVVTTLSIVYTSADPMATWVLSYDRVVAPMCLYLIVRLLRPTDRDLRRLLPVVVGLLLAESLIALMSWTVPGLLPPAWLFEDARTTGSFSDPDVFGAAMLFCGLFVLQAGLRSDRWPVGRAAALALFTLAMLMGFLTFSRGNWLATIVVVVGALYVCRDHARLLVSVLLPIGIVLVGSGLLAGQLELAGDRLGSPEARESALARLPVAQAAVRMLEQKPLIGWGYGNFDRYSRPFQTRIGDLVDAEKPRSSHNLYLTTLAEQGLVGFGLYVGPAVYWLVRTRSSSRRMSRSDRRLVWLLWLGVAAFFIVNNFSVMKLSFGLGLYWLTLGLIGTVVDRYRNAPRPSKPADPRRAPVPAGLGVR